MSVDTSMGQCPCRALIRRFRIIFGGKISMYPSQMVDQYPSNRQQASRASRLSHTAVQMGQGLPMGDARASLSSRDPFGNVGADLLAPWRDSSPHQETLLPSASYEAYVLHEVSLTRFQSAAR